MKLELALSIFITIVVLCLICLTVILVLASMPSFICKDKPDNYTLVTQGSITCDQVRNITSMEG